MNDKGKKRKERKKDKGKKKERKKDKGKKKRNKKKTERKKGVMETIVKV